MSRFALIAKPYPNFALLLLRVGASLLMFFGHGLDKVMQYSERAGNFPSYFGLGSSATYAFACFAEFVCPIFIAIGFRTRLFCIPVFATMAIAALVAHGQDPLAQKELALLYMLAFLVVLFAGPGRYSVDGRTAQ